MAKPPAQKPDPSKPPEIRVLPMELQVGDRLTDETGEWEVIGPPYTTAGGRIVHARVQRIHQPASWEIRNWDAFYEHGAMPQQIAAALADRCRAGIRAHVLLGGFRTLLMPAEYRKTIIPILLG
jgi:hypothetical protein